MAGRQVGRLEQGRELGQSFRLQKDFAVRREVVQRSPASLEIRQQQGERLGHGVGARRLFLARLGTMCRSSTRRIMAMHRSSMRHTTANGIRLACTR